MYSVVLLIIFATSVHNALSHKCYPNNTVIYDNPDSKYVSFFAYNDNDVVCTIATIFDYMSFSNVAEVEISGCDINVGIIIIMSPGPLSGLIVGGRDVYSVYIKCAEIDVMGITRTVTQGLSPSLSTVREAAVTPTFDVFSALRLGDEYGPEQTTATVGDKLVWTYDVPFEYEAILTECKVYAGTTVYGNGTGLITNGDDTYMVSTFTTNYATVAHKRRYYTDFWPFKFYNNDFITIHCTVRFCPTSLSSTACQVGCFAPRKRWDKTAGIAKGSLGEVALIGRKRRAIGSEVNEPQIKDGTLSRVLKVFPKDEILSSSASILVSSWGGVASFGVTLVLRWV